MNFTHRTMKTGLSLILLVLLQVATSSTLATSTMAQGSQVDYRRALDIRRKYQGLAVDVAERATWINSTSRFWYRKSVTGGGQFVIVDAEALSKRPAFDHERLAASLSAAAAEKYTGTSLPFTSISFVDNEGAIQFTAARWNWKCDLSDYSCKKLGAAPQFGQGRPPEDEPPTEFENDVYDGMVQLPAQAGRAIQRPAQEGTPERGSSSKAAPDGRWEALIENYNVFLRPKGKAEASPLSYDGSEGNYYTLRSINWSPDSKHLIAYRVKPGYRREVHYVESSPTDQLQPKHSAREYSKPGDTVDIARPVLFDAETGKQTIVDESLFPNPYSLSEPRWWKDGRGFTFEYNQRGHQVYRVIEVDAATGKARALISEEPETFFSYRPLTGNLREAGTLYRHEIADGKEIIWSSERDGWRHLYLYDGASGKVKNQITKGNWVVRAVDKVDEEKRQIWFQASGMYPGKDPYFTHYYRVNFDGSGLVALTEADGSHTVSYSADMKYYVDTWSRVDQAPIS